jgi:hypothetical protein
VEYIYLDLRLMRELVLGETNERDECGLHELFQSMSAEHR